MVLHKYIYMSTQITLNQFTNSLGLACGLAAAGTTSSVFGTYLSQGQPSSQPGKNDLALT